MYQNIICKESKSLMESRSDISSMAPEILLENCEEWVNSSFWMIMSFNLCKRRGDISVIEKKCAQEELRIFSTCDDNWR